jgi:DnaK suppressor protein
MEGVSADPSSRVAEIRRSLLDHRARLLAEGDAEVRVVEDPLPVASAVDEDEAPHREMDQSIASARNRERARRMRQIEDALKRLADDPEEYGRCVSCDEPIAPGRLALMPFATLCVDCQSGKESGSRATRKKVTDYR